MPSCRELNSDCIAQIAACPRLHSTVFDRQGENLIRSSHPILSARIIGGSARPGMRHLIIFPWTCRIFLGMPHDSRPPLERNPCQD